MQIGGGLGLHPRLSPLKTLYDKGQLAVVTGVGYPNPNRSHFQSMDIWQTGNPQINAQDRTGWLARYFDSDGHFQGNPLSGVSLGSALPLALFATQSPASVIGNGTDYGFGNNGPDQGVRDALKALYAQGTVAGSNAEFVRNVGSDAYASTAALKQAFNAYDAANSAASAKYPPGNGLASGLQTISKLIVGGVGSRVYYLSLGGFDTHANQPGQHANLMGQLADAVTAFVGDLEQHGKAQDVTVMTFSEFGRRCKENGSQGTDHVRGQRDVRRGRRHQGRHLRGLPQPRGPGGRRPALPHRLPLGLRHPAGQLARCQLPAHPRRRVPPPEFCVNPAGSQRDDSLVKKHER